MSWTVLFYLIPSGKQVSNNYQAAGNLQKQESSVSGSYSTRHDLDSHEGLSDECSVTKGPTLDMQEWQQ